MAEPRPEKNRGFIRIVSAPSTEELATGKVGEKTIEHLAGGEILTRSELDARIKEELGE